MEKIYTWLIVFGLIFIFYLLFVILNKKKMAKVFQMSGARLIKGRYDVNFDNINKRKFAFLLALTDSFIFATTFVVMILFENTIISFLVAIPVLLTLIIGLYSLIGSRMKKKEVKKDV